MRRLLISLTSFLFIFLLFFFLTPKQNVSCAATCASLGGTCTTNSICGAEGVGRFSNATGCTVSAPVCCNFGSTPTPTNKPTPTPTTRPDTCTSSTQYCIPSNIGCASEGDVAGVGQCSNNTYACCKISQQGGGYDCSTSGCTAHTGSGTGTYPDLASCNRDCTNGINGGQCPVCPNTVDSTSSFYFVWQPSTQKCEDDHGDTEDPTFTTCPSGQYCFNGQGCGFNYNNGAGFQTGQLPCGTPSGGQTNCNTAIGPISVTAQGLVTSFFAIILSIAGVLAVILIIISGYRLTTSQGNPEAIQHGREQLTAAIVGLLFVILSFTILRLIGVDILNLAQQ